MAVAEHFVGRAAELGSIDGVLDELDRGITGVLELVGEPGIGKTRLLAELAVRADARGYLVLSGSAAELETDLPFWVFVDALDDYVRGLEPSRLEPLGDETRAELAQVLPSLPSVASDYGAPLQQERYRAHRAVRALLERLAFVRPLVLTLDDLHWADTASLELVAALVQRPPAAPVYLALGIRAQQVPDRIAPTLERARRAGTLTRLEIAGLSLDEARELLVGDEATKSLYEVSGGNPFYLAELARSGLDGRHDAPHAVIAALGEEVRMLGDQTRVVLQGAAVAGDPFEPELAASAAGVGIDAALTALDELLGQRLVYETDVPHRFRFRHPLVRRAVYESAPAAWRLGAHERCADSLAAKGSPATARAHHVERSAAVGDADAIVVLREAGDAALHRAPGSAEHWYGACVRLLPELGPAEERIELLLARASALSGMGRLGDGHAVLLDAIATAPAKAEALRLRLVAACARLEHLMGRHNDARTRLEASLADTSDATTARVALMLELAVGALYRLESDAVVAWATRALDEVHEDDALLRAEALALRAAAVALAGTAGGTRDLDDATALVDSVPDEVVAAQLDALAYVAVAHCFADRFPEAVRQGERARRIVRIAGRGDLEAALFPVLGSSLALMGRNRDAAEVLDDAIEAARLVDNQHTLAFALTDRAFAALAAGEVELAMAFAEECGRVVSASDVAHPRGSIVGTAHAFFELGQPEHAAKLVVEAAGPSAELMHASWRTRTLDLLTRCTLQAGLHDEAERLAGEARASAESGALPLARAFGVRARAHVALARGDAATAARDYLEAAATLEETGDLYDAMRTRVLAGRALAQTGDVPAATAELERAAAAFDSFGSTRYRAEAEQELRKLGKRVHRQTAAGKRDGTGVELLTERERELAQLVVQRKTNAQIAAELFLSQKTVESHLRNIFRKVGVANRVDLAREVERA